MKRKTRLRAKRSKPRRIQGVRNEKLLAWIRTQPCFRCELRGVKQTSKTEAAHIPQSRRYGDEDNVWPLCASCHRTAKDSFHAGAQTFAQTLGWHPWELVGISTGFTREFRRSEGIAA